MLRISKLADYGTVIMSGLAQAPEHFWSASEVAAYASLPKATVGKLLKIFVKHGLLESSRGTGGGYRLARPANQITVAEIISAIDGAPAMTECVTAKGVCDQEGVCTLKGNWQVINRVVTGALGRLTLDDMSKPLSGTL